MPRSQLKISETANLHPLPRDEATGTQTAWANLWVAVSEALQEPAIACPLREARDRTRRQEKGRRITEEINDDPAEVERLRRARENARAGRTYPRHSDTS